MSARSFSLQNFRSSQALDHQSIRKSNSPSISYDASFDTTPSLHELDTPGSPFSNSDLIQKAIRISSTSSNIPSPYAKSGLIELTKNSKYCVLKVPSTPVVLKNSSQHDYLTGTTDDLTSYSLIVSDKGAYVWKYITSDEIPQVYFFEAPQGSSFPPLGTLVSPIAGVKEPGLITIGSETGVITYWESVGSAVANELLQKKKSITKHIRLYGSERIEVISNIEPAGIVASTNTGRFILITYRDGTGKPTLEYETMKNSGSGFFATLKDAVTLTGSRRNVISIKPGKSMGRDERHAVIVTSTGNLMIWDCFRTGQAHLILEEGLREVMLNTITSLYQHASATFTVHDVECHNDLDYIYILASFVNNQATAEISYILFTFSTEQNVLNIVTAHKFKTFTSPSSCRPRLLLPKPYNTLFVLFSDAVILTDAVPDSLHELGSVPRWEDIVTFLSGVEAFAFGKEDLVEVNKKVTRYPGVIAMTKQAGILRIERYTNDQEGTSSENQKLITSDLEPEIAKTKIEQAVFYSHRDEGIVNPVDFEIRKEFKFDSTVLDKAFSQVSNEIVTSTSPYLPPTLPSFGEHLEIRWEALDHLVLFLHENFPNELSLNYRLSLLWDLEKFYAAKSLWIEYNKKLTTPLAGAEVILPEIIFATNISGKGDKVRNWFTHKIKDIGKLLFQASLYSAKHKTNIQILEEVNNILLIAITFSAYPTRATYGPQYFGVTDHTYTSLEPWTGTNELLKAFEHQYDQTVETLESLSKNDQHYVKLASQLVHIVGTVCHIYCDRISWLKESTKENSQREHNKLLQSYEKSRGSWIQKVCKFGHKQEAQEISEKYKIYRSLAEILGEDYRTEVKFTGKDTVSSFGIIAKLRGYINTFGYDFASVLFQYYVETQQLKSLLTQFPEFNEYLEKFLASGNYGRFSWIHDLLAGNNSKAASTLFTVATESEGSNANKRLQLSIAKLSSLAVGKQDAKSSSLQQRINSQLEFVGIQEIINDQIQVNLGKNGDQVTVYIDQVSEFLKSHNMNQLTSVFRRALTRLVNKQPLKTEELVDILTLRDVGDSFNTQLSFVYALKLIYLPTANLTEAQVKFNEQLIWRRLFLRDDWAKLDQTENKSDIVVERSFSNTILYETLVNIFRDGLEEKISLSYVLDPEKAIWTGSESDLTTRYPTEIGATDNKNKNKAKGIISDINTENTILKSQINNYNLVKWAQGVYSRVEKEYASQKNEDGVKRSVPKFQRSFLPEESKNTPIIDKDTEMVDQNDSVEVLEVDVDGDVEIVQQEEKDGDVEMK